MAEHNEHGALVPASTGVIVERGVLGTQDVLARVTRILEIQKSVMKERIHFGVIPGTPKPTLYKPGAEKLLMTFRIGHRPTTVEEARSEEEIRYRVLVEGFNQTTGEVLGSAWGEASSQEEKYRWRKPVCDEEWQETPMDHRREVWKRGSEGKAYKTKQVRTAPADVANTILQMADKRALVQMTRVVLACSDIFDQDLEDMPTELRESLLEGQGEAKSLLQRPERKSTTQTSPPAPISAASPTIAPTPLAPVAEPPKSEQAKGEYDDDTLIITACDPHQGTTNGRAWKFWGLKFSNGQEAVTFDTEIGELAEACRASGVGVEALIEPSPKKPGKFILTELARA